MKYLNRAFPRGMLFVAALATMLVACGGRETTASKSAAAYDEARKNGVPIAAGEHGGHVNEAAHDAMPGMDRGAMTATDANASPHMAGMNHSAMPEMDHSKMPGMQHGASTPGAHDMAGMNHSSMPGMDHSRMPGMQHGASMPGAHEMAGMNHSAMPAMQHSGTATGAHEMAGMDHGTMPGMSPGGSMRSMPGMQHAAAKPPVAIPPPVTNAAIAKTQPNATLHPDEFDAPSPSAVQESARASSGMNHPMTHDAPAQPQPKPAPEPPGGHQHHENGEGS